VAQGSVVKRVLARDTGAGHESFQSIALQLRGRTGLTQRQLASSLGMHWRSIQGWESGANYPTAESLRSLLAAYLRAGGFTLGNEAVEAAACWSAALRQSPRLRTPLDDVWWAALVTQQIPRLQAGAADGRRQDLGEAPDVLGFQGREQESATLQRWVMVDNCRVVALVGLGGIGKTILAARLVDRLAPEFDHVYWRSLRNALHTNEWLAGAIAFVSARPMPLPEAEAGRIEVLLESLRDRRSLLVLDNFETVLQPGELDGRYRDGYAGYGNVLRRLSETRHRSCLLLTSREAPPELGALEGDRESVRSLELGGLSVGEAQALLQHRGLVGNAAAWAGLVEHYGGNGLALKITGETIRHLFGGDIAAFLEKSEPVFGGVRRLLDDQVARLTDIEGAVLRWLAVEREPVSFAALSDDLGPMLGAAAVLEAVQSLRRRSFLVERRGYARALSLQSVVLEYVTQRLVADVVHEIATLQPAVLLGQALVKATANEYVRRSQERLIAAPVLERLNALYGSERDVEGRLSQLLESLRGRPRVEQGFAPGNLVNLLRLLRGDPRDLDL